MTHPSTTKARDLLDQLDLEMGDRLTDIARREQQRLLSLDDDVPVQRHAPQAMVFKTNGNALVEPPQPFTKMQTEALALAVAAERQRMRAHVALCIAALRDELVGTRNAG